MHVVRSTRVLVSFPANHHLPATIRFLSFCIDRFVYVFQPRSTLDVACNGSSSCQYFLTPEVVAPEMLVMPVSGSQDVCNSISSHPPRVYVFSPSSIWSLLAKL
ncbi:hypothetical protein SESBI_31410 [Sesbania bispinosa]|nr:hypothetical protein SESBI_31410 [Sesbania bispinosa]